jgi:putative addiction module CopG family antidote
MNISLPQTLKAFVDVQVSQRGYGTSSEYVRELIRKDQDRLQLREKLLAGASSAPTAPATATVNTTLLTCQSNRFIDNSTNNFTITRNGDTSVQRFNPFGTSTAYSISVIGGSGYFDGTGDYLQTPTNAAFTFGTGDFQIECWLYPLVTPDNFDFVMNGNGSDAVFWACRGSNLDFTNNDDTAGALSTTYPTLNAWTHLAVVRSGTTVSLYKNGVRQATATSSFNWSQTNFTFMAPNAGTSVFTNGYMSDARILKGSTTYNPSSTTITIPTAPLTAVSGTSVLLNMTNGAIFDNAMMNDLETVGNAQISTSVVKYGTGSLAFDGTGDFLKGAFNPWVALGTGDYTIELWINFNSVSTSVFFGDIDSSGNGNWAFFYNSSAGVLRLLMNNGAVTISSSSWSPSTGIWYHIAISRASGTYRFFVNGTLTGSGSDSTNITWGTNNFYVGSASDGGLQLNGYIDDLRITKGYARYTTTFTPPTAAFPNIGPT